jgi:hypothetical protein
MTAPRDVSFDDYMVQSMKDPAEAAAYIEAVIDLEDPAALLVALVLTINLWQPSNGSEARPLATEQATARDDSPRT